MSTSPTGSQRSALLVLLGLLILTAITRAHPMLDAITRWAKKASETKLGRGMLTSFFAGGQLKSDETTEDPMEFDKQVWLQETGQVKVRRFVLNQRERGDYILKFRRYYDCLERKRRSREAVVATAVVLKAGATASADCKVCQYPSRGDNSIWRRLLFRETATEDVPVDMEHFVVSPSMRLTIQGAVPGDAGIYICQSYYTIYAVYNVDVVAVLGARTVHGPNAPAEPKATPDLDLPGHNLHVYTEWSEWSSCSRCDRVGKRFRSGMCFVRPIQPGKPIRLRPGQENKVTMSAFQRFPAGLPCKTRLLPDELRALRHISNRTAEREVRYCKVPCPRTRVWIVRDAFGNVREVWKKNNRSIVENLEPPVTSYVHRRTTYTSTGKRIRIKCSGADRSKVVQWQKGGRLLDPVGYRRETKGRVFIDINKVVHVRRAALNDSGLYTCWQKNNMVASVKLVVEYNVYFKYKEYIVVVGISCLALGIAGALLYMCLRACYKKCGGGKKKPKMIITK